MNAIHRPPGRAKRKPNPWKLSRLQHAVVGQLCKVIIKAVESIDRIMHTRETINLIQAVDAFRFGLEGDLEAATSRDEWSKHRLIGVYAGPDRIVCRSRELPAITMTTIIKMLLDFRLSFDQLRDGASAAEWSIEELYDAVASLRQQSGGPGSRVLRITQFGELRFEQLSDKHHQQIASVFSKASVKAYATANPLDER